MHPHYDEGKHKDLETAKEHAEAVTGRSLNWRWVSGSQRWRASLPMGQAAEISEEPDYGPPRIDVVASVMR
ncbi:hypothetical protein [Arthrobacter sp. NPDC057013]|uniref:hypothetical protein n=1 Tax=Arthrobacter sp. NPDC057013 TaxID=3345999 RepID=UPI00363801AF